MAESGPAAIKRQGYQGLIAARCRSFDGLNFRGGFHA